MDRGADADRINGGELIGPRRHTMKAESGLRERGKGVRWRVAMSSEW